jgi:hypothetical protein
MIWWARAGYSLCGCSLTAASDDPARVYQLRARAGLQRLDWRADDLVELLCLASVQRHGRVPESVGCLELPHLPVDSMHTCTCAASARPQRCVDKH